MTMNTSWGYKWYDNNWKSGESLIHMLVDIASKGGNLLLNVGPTAEGVIPDSSVVRLQQIGNWLKMNGESVYGTSASPFFKLDWGRCTQKKENGKTTFYLHVFDWPKEQVLIVPGLKARIQDVYLLANPNQKFAWKFEDGNFTVTTAMENLGAMMKKLEALKIEPENAQLQRIPKDTTKLDIESAKKVMRLIEMFEEDDDIQAVYHNLEMTDELMEAL